MIANLMRRAVQNDESQGIAGSVKESNCDAPKLTTAVNLQSETRAERAVYDFSGLTDFSDYLIFSRRALISVLGRPESALSSAS